MPFFQKPDGFTVTEALVAAIFRYHETILNTPNILFLALFAFRYVRLFGNIIGWYVYRPTPVPRDPTLGRSDATVIIPTVDPEGHNFGECLQSVLANAPGALIISTVGMAKHLAIEQKVETLRDAYPSTTISVISGMKANKRGQVGAALPLVKTKIVVLVDDHVFWPSPNFLPTVLAPLEVPGVGVVGTNKRVRRDRTGSIMTSFQNFLGCIYLERHNFEIRSTNAIDGGVFVLSGRTSIWRTTILQDPAFLQKFTNEYFFFGMFGPLNADDDNCLTRWAVSHGWKIKIQYSEDSMIETTIGTSFLSRCLRWARTTWRSNSASLFTDPNNHLVWRNQSWTVYAAFITQFFNFALFYDPALLYVLYNHTTFGHSTTALYQLAAFIFCTKLIKLLSHFSRHPKDLIFLPGYLLFAYFHSLIKLWSLLTFWSTSWGGRDLSKVNADANGSPSSSNDSAPSSSTNTETTSSNGSFRYDSEANNSRTSSTSTFSYSPTNSYHSSSSSGSSYPSSYSTASSSHSHSSTQYPTHFSTPFGPVSTINPLFTPVNVLESHDPTWPQTRDSSFSPTPSPSAQLKSELVQTTKWTAGYVKGKMSGYPGGGMRGGKGRVWKQVPYGRTWSRGMGCGRQHAEGKELCDGRCVVGGLDGEVS